MKIISVSEDKLIKSRVSIIVPFYNRMNLLSETIESVLAQTYQNWELILVDDGSTDESAEIAEKYARQYPERVSCIHHEGNQNHGNSASRQLGFIMSKGEFVLFLDSDDVLLSQKLQVSIDVLNENREVDAVFSATQYWYSRTQDLQDKRKDFIWEPWKNFNIPISKGIQPPSLVHYLLVHSVMPCVHSLMMRREILEQIGGWNTGYKNYSFEDQVFYLKLFMQATTYIMPGWFEKYRVHENSITGKVNKKGSWLHERIFFLDWVKNYLKSQNFHDAQIDDYLEKELAPYKNPVDPSKTYVPLPVGIRNFGDLHRLSPISKVWGFDRGPIGRGNRAQNVDRYYIEGFLQRHTNDIKGRVLEVGDSLYTHEFGGDRVEIAEVLDANPDNLSAVYIYDLAVGGDNFPENMFDCFILVQTLLLIYDVKSAIVNAYKALKPDGVLLVTVPGISQVCTEEMLQWGDYWRFTTASAQRLFGDIFGTENVQIESYGNVLSASAFLFNLGASELKKEELDFNDPNYQVTIAVRAIKKERSFNNFGDKVEIQTAETENSKPKFSEMKSNNAWQFPLIVRGKHAIAKAYKILLDRKRLLGRFLSLKKNSDILVSSTLFDAVWYLNNYRDVANSRMGAASHYLLYGGFEGRNPGPEFDSQWYLNHYQDIKQAGVNPLLHYIKFGKAEGRLPKSDAELSILEDQND